MMNTTSGLAPAVQDILDGAADREPPDCDRVSVAGRSLPRALADAAADGRTPVVAEVKPTSPTTDGTRDADPVALAEAMVAGGAAALSVLTEPDHFGGSTDALERVRDAVDVPVLRKDFVLRDRQLDAVASDVVLLIARFLDDERADDLATMLAGARERGLQPLVEVHTVAELGAALGAGADLVGVNNRDLASLTVDRETFETVTGTVDVPADVTLLAESGVESPAHARRMRAAGADGVLVGSAIMAGLEDGLAGVRAATERLTAAEPEGEV
jgi:indole-3-glycerol phosphate synthase